MRGSFIPNIGNVLRGGGVALAVVTALSPSIPFAQDRLAGTQIGASAGALNYSIVISEIDLSEASMTADRLKAVIGSGTVKELAAVKAKRILIPKIVVADGGAGQTPWFGISLTNIVLNDVHDGLADGMTIGSIAFRGLSRSMTVDNITARHVDVSGLLFPPDRSVATNTTVMNPSFALQKLSFDMPDPGLPAQIKVDLLSLEATVEGFHNGVPTNIDIGGIGLVFDLPAKNGNPLLASLRAAGVTEFRGTFRIAATWDASYDRITISEASLGGLELGGVFLTAEITSAGKALFSRNLDEARAALSALAVRFITMTISGNRLGAILAGAMAKSGSGDTGSGRAVLAAAADVAVRRLLSASDDASALGDAVRQFVGGAANYLEITAVAKTEPGIDVTDLAGLPADLPTILPRMKFDALTRP